MPTITSPLKLSTWTSTQVTPVPQAPQNDALVSEEPVLVAVHHWPDCCTRPVMSALPSWLKSPTWTSTQVTEVDQLPHGDDEKPAPVSVPTHHRPVCSTRPTMSGKPSPLKSPTVTFTQFTSALQVAHREVVNPWPVESAVHH